MNKILSYATVVIVAVQVVAFAASPTYSSKSDIGAPGNTSAEVIFPSDPTRQIRVVNVYFESDTNVSTLAYTSGEGAWTQTATNAASSSVTNQVNSTNGLVVNSTLVLEHGGTGYSATLSSLSQSTNSGTNIVLASGGWGVATSIGDNIYQMGTATRLYIGTGTNAQNGEALFVGNVGRPVRIVLGPTGRTNQINSVAHYD